MPRIGLKALGINLDPIKDLTIAEVYGEGVVPVTECSKRFWALIKEKDLKVKLQIKSEKTVANTNKGDN
jgi:hypothetical protein